MTRLNTVRAWKGSRSRSASGGAPPHPAGSPSLTDEELLLIVSGARPKCTCSPSAITSVTTHPTCPDC
jgi:mersacidin/lichenicidin family type 2 lantibiotic